jgi:hypothetical protein
MYDLLIRLTSLGFKPYIFQINHYYKEIETQQQKHLRGEVWVHKTKLNLPLFN